MSNSQNREIQLLFIDKKSYTNQELQKKEITNSDAVSRTVLPTDSGLIYCSWSTSLVQKLCNNSRPLDEDSTYSPLLASLVQVLELQPSHHQRRMYRTTHWSTYGPLMLLQFHTWSDSVEPSPTLENLRPVTGPTVQGLLRH